MSSKARRRRARGRTATVPAVPDAGRALAGLRGSNASGLHVKRRKDRANTERAARERDIRAG